MYAAITALLSFDVLTDAALADLRFRIAEDVRRERSRRSAARCACYLASIRTMFLSP